MNAVKRMWAVLAGLGGLAASARGAELAWVELTTSGAPASAATFYEKTFGWTAERLGEGDWDPVVLRRGDRVIAGVAHRQGERLAKARTRWLGFFAAEDAAAVEKRAEEAGGRVIEESHRGAAVGAKQVLLADGEGAVFGLVSGLADGTKGGRGVWPVALANDTPAAAKFYHTVLGGEVRDEKRTPMFRGDFLLMEGAQAWAGVQPASVGGRAGWIFLIGVADIDATVAQNPFGHGYISCALLDLMQHGWEPRKTYQFIDSGAVMVTRENVDTFQNDVERTTQRIVDELTKAYLKREGAK